MVVSQPNRFNLILKDAETGVLVDGGTPIPLDQILAGPRRARLHFATAEEGSDADPPDVRSYSQMISGARTSSGDLTRDYLAGRRKGWGPLAQGAVVAYQTAANGPSSKELTIGRVLVNDRAHQTVLLQPYEAHWSGSRAVSYTHLTLPTKA